MHHKTTTKAIVMLTYSNFINNHDTFLGLWSSDILATDDKSFFIECGSSVSLNTALSSFLTLHFKKSSLFLHQHITHICNCLQNIFLNISLQQKMIPRLQAGGDDNQNALYICPNLPMMSSFSSISPMIGWVAQHLLSLMASASSPRWRAYVRLCGSWLVVLTTL